MDIVFLVEELSMKYLLEGILPRIITAGKTYKVIHHEGKSDLRKAIPVKLKAWPFSETKFIIIQDQDANDCRKLKNDLVSKCAEYNRPYLVRIACHELEAWYFGDLKAVGAAYNIDLAKYEDKAKYRIPDDIVHPKKELKKLVPALQQIEGAKKISTYMDIGNNRSKSFQVFVSGVKRMCE